MRERIQSDRSLDASRKGMRAEMTAKAKMIVARIRRWFSDPLRNQYVANPVIARIMDMDRERLRLASQFWHFGFLPGHRSFFTSDIADLLQDGQELRFILTILPVYTVSSIPESDFPLWVSSRHLTSNFSTGCYARRSSHSVRFLATV